MSTIMLKPYKSNIVTLSANFVDYFMPKARGEYVKVYITLLRYTQMGEDGVTSNFLADILGLLETDVFKALEYWDQVGLISLHTIDAHGSMSIEIKESQSLVSPLLTRSEENPVQSEKPTSEPEKRTENMDPMLQEISMLMGRPLSSSEAEKFLYFKEQYKLAEEVIILLVQHCVLKGKPNMKYIETVAISWDSQGIKTAELAQQNIKKHEEKWMNYRKVLTYIGMSDKDIPKPQEDLLEKWFYTFGFTTEMILKACDISFNTLGKVEMGYINGILRSWLKDDIKTLQDIEKNEKKPRKSRPTKKSQDKDFTEREYDYDDLERKLLGWDK
ncbi:DnaD domain protein [Proteiniclasticum sp.]|uniref:DnaD domain protein n=1 Tax=Proteiniclasticum sp. TaxID=2053595 RepID=UPI0028968AF3|nr:DnaD domain protein [Proteiniclasticum sp.]